MTRLSSTALRILAGLAACLFALALQWRPPDLAARLDEGLRDAFVRLLADPTPESRIAVIDIDEASLREIGPWPWSRGKLADLVEILLGPYGAHGVGLDIVLPEAADRVGDARLAVLASQAPVTFAQIFDYTVRYPPIRLGTLAGGEPVGAGGPTLEALGYIANHAGLAGARCVGNIGYMPDSDGILRHTPALTRYEQRIFRHFASTLFSCSTSGAPAQAADGNGLWRVPHRHTLSSYTVVSAREILAERAPASLLQGRYILVGSSSLGLGDRVSSPLAPLVAGVMVHAESLSGLLDEAQGSSPGSWSGHAWLSIWLVASIAFAVACMPHLPAWGNVLTLLGLAAGWLGLSLWGVARQVEWSITAPLWAYLFLLLSALPLEWWQTQRRARRLINTFSHYVAQPVLDEILRQDLIHSLEPTLREMTVLIADMEGYTRTTSSLSLEEAARLTKDFLDCLTRPVLALGGTLDRYSGDGLVAFWGAPLDCPDQADWAVSAALRICHEIDAFNQSRKEKELPPVRVRIGIESGMALVGDLGTPFRSTYTAVGDCINFASRLEAAARDLPANLVIGETANAKLRQHRTRSMGKIYLRGTKTSMDVFTVEAGTP